MQDPRNPKKEILGVLQKEMCERLDKLEEKYPMLRQRKMFWLEAKKIVGDLDRYRVKQMRKNYNKICKRVQEARCGATWGKEKGGKPDRRSSPGWLQIQRHQKGHYWREMAVESS